MTTPADAARVLLHRRQCRASLLAYATHVVASDPRGPFTPALHHQLLIASLQWVADTPDARLMVMMPPGSAKSTYASVIFPSWMMSRPGTAVIGGSHTAGLALDFSGKVQGAIVEHGAILATKLRNEAKDRWYATNGSAYLASGVGGAVTGFRADCVAEGTIIQTNKGLIAIESVAAMSETCYVLSYEKQTNRPVYRRVLAVARRRSEDRWRIISAHGRMVEATGNHRFYVGGAFVQAQALSVGDVLLRALPIAERADGIRNVQAGKKQQNGTILRFGMLNHGVERSERPSFCLQTMRPARAVQTPKWAQHEILQRDLQNAASQRKSVSSSSGLDAIVPSLREILLPAYRRNESGMFAPVRGGVALNQDGGGEQPWMEGWGNGVAREAGDCESFLSDETHNPCPGRHEVRRLCVDQPLGGSSYRSEPREQRSIQSCDALQPVPHGMASDGEIQVADDTVALVERVCEPGWFYDIQVEGTECFFANGILVHNCIIIDDPVKSRADADSETYRNTTWAWYNDDLTSRMRPGGRVVLVMTRWHEDDLAGRLLASEPDKWRVLRLPAFADAPDDPLGRAIGEPLWADDGYGFAKLLADRRDDYLAKGLKRSWAALYQQSPRADDGNLFKIEALRVVDAVGPIKRSVRGWDLASIEGGGDWTAGVLLHQLADDAFVLADMVRLRGGPEDVEAAIVATASRDGRGVRVALPQDPGQAGKSQVLYLTRKLAGYVVESAPETGDKATRAAPVAAQANIGNLSLLRAGWNIALIEEMRSFPSGLHDDQVDALAKAFNVLTAVPKPSRNAPFIHMQR